MIPTRTVLLTLKSSEDDIVAVPMPSVDFALRLATELIGSPLRPVPARREDSYGWMLFDGIDQVAAIIVVGAHPELN